MSLATRQNEFEANFVPSSNNFQYFVLKKMKLVPCHPISGFFHCPGTVLLGYGRPRSAEDTCEEEKRREKWWLKQLLGGYMHE